MEADMNKKELFRMVTIGCFLVLVAAGVAVAAGKGTGKGILTSFENDGSVIIEEKGYLLSPSVTIQNYTGERITQRSLSVPCLVYFEYEYTPQGVVIRLIKEIPQ